MCLVFTCPPVYTLTRFGRCSYLHCSGANYPGLVVLSGRNNYSRSRFAETTTREAQCTDGRCATAVRECCNEHDSPRTPNVHSRAPALQKNNQNSTRRLPEIEKDRKWWREREKSVKFWAPHPSGRTLRGPTLPDPTLGGCTLQNWLQPKIGRGQNRDGQKWIGQNWPNQDGQNGIGQSRSLSLEGLRPVPGGDSVLPFVLQFYGNPSSYLWDDGRPLMKSGKRRESRVIN